MPTETQPLTLRVQRVDGELDLAVDLGTVAFGPQGQLTVISAEPGFESFLASVVATTNKRKELSIKVPPPKGSQPGVYLLAVPRTAPDLLEMMEQFMQQTYDLHLEAVE
jgi:hypothetical protein